MDAQPSAAVFDNLRCVVFDFGFTLSSDYYFNVDPPGVHHWYTLFQQHIFADPALVDRWMCAELSLEDIARRIAPYVGLDLPEIVSTMERGCENLRFNPAVLDFALACSSRGWKTALVTANMDVFSKIVAPALHLDEIFDIIINTYDYRELRKECLWPVAFERLGPGIGYANSLLIEDGSENTRKFRALGGRAYQYSDDPAFLAWLASVGWR